MPAALRAAGLVQALDIEDAGNLQVAIADPVRDAATGVIGLRDLLGLSKVVRDEVAELLHRGRRPLVIGGDCTLLIGVAAALARTNPEAGLLFIDGHLDCYDGSSSPTGEGADMELAVLLGHGPPPLIEFGERTPAFAHNRVIVLGPYDESDAARDGAPSPRAFASETVIVTSEELAENPSRHASEALGRLGQTAQGFWLHIDLDVLSGNEFPAVDYPDPRGLTFTQLRDVLSTAFASPELLGASVVILNPNRDPTGGQAATQVTKLLADALRPRPQTPL